MLKLFRETESIGITDDIESATPLPIEAKRNEEISFDGRHYEVALPWKEDCFPRTNNYRMCEIRLRSLHFKLKKDPPFTHIGLDFAGPLYVETKTSEDESDESQKVYVCLLTCASTRAVHLELKKG